MTINLQLPDIQELKPHITVFGVGGGGSNAVNNMITAGLQGVDFVVGNTDAQALSMSKCERIIQMGVTITEGLGAGSQPGIGQSAAEEAIDEITDHLSGAHMVFITAGMGGGTGTGAAPVVAKIAKEQGILTVGVVTKPFQFEGRRRMELADNGIEELQKYVDTLIVIPNQNLFRVATEATTFADAFGLADEVLFSGVACITDLMVKEGLINLDFADVRTVMQGMGKAMMGTGEASGDRRALQAAEAAIANPLLDETSMRGAKGLLISITGGRDLTLFEVDEAATRIREEVDDDANIIVGATFDDNLEGKVRVSVVGTGIDMEGSFATDHYEQTQMAGDADYGVTPKPTTLSRPIKALIGLDAVMKSEKHQQTDTLGRSGRSTSHNLTRQPASARATISEGEYHSLDYGQQGSDLAPKEAMRDDGQNNQVDDYDDRFEQGVGNANLDIKEFPEVAQRAYQSSKAQTPHENSPLSLLRKLANVGLAKRVPAPQPAPTRIEPMVDQGYDGESGHEVQKPKIVISRRHTDDDNGQYPQQETRVIESDRFATSRQKSLNANNDVDIPAFLRRRS